MVFSLLFSVFPCTFAINQDDPWSVHEHDYYGRKLLENMPNSVALLYAYDSLAYGVEHHASSIPVFNGIDCLSSQEWRMVLDLYRRDYAQHFWADHFDVTSNSSTILEAQVTYLFEGTQLLAARERFDAAVNEILAGITEDMSQFDKELYFHDVLAERVTYYEGTTNCHNAYGAIVEGYATCDGYAEAFQYLLHREGIQSFIAAGYAYNFKRGEIAAHSWNYVCIDGQFYQTDLTWDDVDGDISYEFFNLPDSEMGEYHYPSDVSYSLPVCDSIEANYHFVMGTRLDTYSVDELAALLSENDYSIAVYIPGNINQFLSWFSKNAKSIAAAAGITSGYKVGYRYLYREYTLVFIPNNATAKVASVEYAGTHSTYTTVAEAIVNADRGYVKLLADCDEDLIIARDLYLDLNSHSMTGNITVLEGATLYGMDSSTDDYNCSSGYGVITNLTGNYAVHHKSAITGRIKRYMAIKDEGGISFHRFFLGVVYVSLQPCATGLGFKAIFAGDQKVVEQLDEEQAYGYKLWLEDGDPVCVYNDRVHFVSGRKVSMLVNNYDIENFGEAQLHAVVMLQLKDGTLIQSTEVSTSMRAMLENLNDHISILSKTQLSALLEMLNEHPIIKLWKTSGFYS